MNHSNIIGCAPKKITSNSLYLTQLNRLDVDVISDDMNSVESTILILLILSFWLEYSSFEIFLESICAAIKSVSMYFMWQTRKLTFNDRFSALECHLNNIAKKKLLRYFDVLINRCLLLQILQSIPVSSRIASYKFSSFEKEAVTNSFESCSQLTARFQTHRYDKRRYSTINFLTHKKPKLDTNSSHHFWEISIRLHNV